MYYRPLSASDSGSVCDQIYAVNSWTVVLFSGIFTMWSSNKVSLILQFMAIKSVIIRETSVCH